MNADHIFDQKYLISVGYFIGAPALVVDYSVVSPQSSLFCSSVHFNFWLVKTSDSSHSSSCVFNAKTSILLYFRSFTRFLSKIYILWKKGILNENHPNFSLCKLYLLYKHTNLNKLHSIPSKKNGLFQFHDTFFHGKFMLILLWTVPRIRKNPSGGNMVYNQILINQHNLMEKRRKTTRFSFLWNMVAHFCFGWWGGCASIRLDNFM